MGHWTFLWITDLHYASPDTNYLDDPKELDNFEQAIRENVFPQFDELLQPQNFEGKDLSFIAIGGDLTTQGKSEGFDRFREECFPKLLALCPDPNAICIVPGNHDVTWALDPQQKGYFDEKFKLFRNLVKQTGMRSCLFPTGQLSKGDQSQKLKFQFDKWPVHVDDQRLVLVLNINSAIRCGELNRKMLVDLREHVAKNANPSAAATDSNPPIAIQKPREDSVRKYLIRDVSHVTQAQVTWLKDNLRSQKEKIGADWNNYMKVAIVHHHVVHYPGQQTEHKGYEFMVDSPLLLELLEEFNFDIVLTGHKQQAYQRTEQFNKKKMFVIGGATVGGYTSEPRGIRLIDFVSTPALRRVEIRDIGTEFAKGDIPDRIRRCEPKRLKSTTPAKDVVMRTAEMLGYRYREVASITVLLPDGDAHRIVECEDLVITKDCDRTRVHLLNLPPTSGYLDRLRVTGKGGLTVKKPPPLPDDHSAKSAANIPVKFQPELSPDPEEGHSYSYEWLAVDAFAMDKLQFKRKYGTEQLVFEYTHFIPKDPIEELTVLVQFPRGFRLAGAPRLRIAKVDPKQENSRFWKIDQETTKRLKSAHALRYYESLNTAAIRVKAPTPDLAYGIQWYFLRRRRPGKGRTC